MWIRRSVVRPHPTVPLHFRSSLIVRTAAQESRLAPQLRAKGRSPETRVAPISGIFRCRSPRSLRSARRPPVRPGYEGAWFAATLPTRWPTRSNSCSLRQMHAKLHLANRFFRSRWQAGSASWNLATGRTPLIKFPVIDGNITGIGEGQLAHRIVAMYL